MILGMNYLVLVFFVENSLLITNLLESFRACSFLWRSMLVTQKIFS